MIRYDILLLLLALIPACIAFIYRLAIIPRRKHNIRDVLDSALTAEEGDDKPERKQYFTKGRQRVQADFESQYTYRLLIPASLLSFFYLVLLPLCLGSALRNAACSDRLVQLLECFRKLPSFDFLLYAAVGSYCFNIGVLVRRTFLADITEHVYWGAIYRLVFTAGLALATHGLLATAAAPIYFLIAFTPGVFFTKLRKAATSVLGDSGPDTSELPLQLVLGIDIWKEQRLQEEGIESVQNLATADVLTLAVKTHYPLRTLIDWIDQAIFIQRLNLKLTAIRNASLPISAVDFAWMSPANNQGSKELPNLVATLSGLDPGVVSLTMDSFFQDTYVAILWSLWQSDGTDHTKPVS
jgi:hypothetical protein